MGAFDTPVALHPTALSRTIVRAFLSPFETERSNVPGASYGSARVGPGCVELSVGRTRLRSPGRHNCPLRAGVSGGGGWILGAAREGDALRNGLPARCVAQGSCARQPALLVRREGPGLQAGIPGDSDHREA